jgi:glutamate synthase (NADPH/NADH) small chain
MGKPTGFMEYLREVAEEIAPSDRIRNWDEFHLAMAEDNLRTQAARCMDCGTPFATLASPLAAWPVAAPSTT